jgi:uncharacterized membrane protein (UPF0127 family)
MISPSPPLVNNVIPAKAGIHCQTWRWALTRGTLCLGIRQERFMDSRLCGNDGLVRWKLGACLLGLMLCLWMTPWLAVADPAAETAAPWHDGQVVKVRMGQHTYSLEVAQSGPAQAKGLMYRTSLPKRHGMIFPFDPPQPVGFWMQHCRMPLDMVFIRPATAAELAKTPNLLGVIDSIAANRPPCPDTAPHCPIYLSSGPVTAVIELSGGEAKRQKVRAQQPVLGMLKPFR